MDGLSKAEQLFLLLVFLISLLLQCAFLQSSVWIANKCLGPPTRRREAGAADEGPEATHPLAEEPQQAIPPPSIKKGIVIALLASAVTFACDFMGRMWLGRGRPAAGVPWRPDPADELVLAGLSLATGFIVWCWLLTFALPTSFNRASLVTLFLYLHIVVLTMAIAIPVAVAVVLAG